MRFLNVVLLVLLWSCFARPSSIPVFQLVEGYQEKPETKKEIADMPRYRSDTLGICYAMSATTIAQKYICRTQKVENCSKLPADKEISPLGMLAWSRRISKEKPITSIESFRGLDFSKAGAATHALSFSAAHFSFPTEQCHQFDMLANEYGHNNVLVEQIEKKKTKWEEVLSIHQVMFEYGKPKMLAQIAAEKSDDPNKALDKDFCEKCILEDVNRDLISNIDKDGLRSAFNKDTFSEYLYALVFHEKCRNETFTPEPQFDSFPPIKSRTDKKQMLSKIKEVIAEKDVPVALDGICLIWKSANKCDENGYHSVVLSGVKEVCKGSNNCRTLVKVHNSWGADWQRKNNDGWVDADSLLSNVDYNTSSLLSWYE